LDIHIYNIKNYNEEVMDFEDDEQEFIFSLEEKKQSEYSVTFQLVKSQKNLADLH
jgi:hypothetical protein